MCCTNENGVDCYYSGKHSISQADCYLSGSNALKFDFKKIEHANL